MSNFPIFIGKHSDKIEKANYILLNNCNKKDCKKVFSKNKAKFLFYKDIKSKTQIQADVYFTYVKNFLSYSPLLFSIIKKSSSLYCLYTIPFVLTHTTIKFLKFVSNKKRPDGINNRSFPSGHVSSSFVGVGYLLRNFNPYLGALAIVLAIGVSSSRLYADRHDIIDVSVGACIGVVFGLFSNNIVIYIRNKIKNFYKL